MYSHLCLLNPIIRTIETYCFGIFGHIITGVVLWLRNKQARPQNHEMNDPSANSTFFSRTMFLSGSIITFFFVVHLRTFWIPTRFIGEGNSYLMVKEAFQSPLYDFFMCLQLSLLHFIYGMDFNRRFKPYIKHKNMHRLLKQLVQYSGCSYQYSLRQCQCIFIL